MSTQISSNPAARGPARKRGLDIYTVMLLLSVLFMTVAVIAMTIEMRRYLPQLWKTDEARPVVGMMVGIR